ncbi:MAG: VanW family protein [Bacilli bacterium]|nr:VanW family protein [Bacilli bacterium]
MRVKNNKVSRISLLGIVAIIITTFILVLSSSIVFVTKRVNSYKNRTYKNTYLGQYDISELKYENLKEKIKSITSDYLNSKVILIYGDNKIETTYEKLGFKLDSEKMYNNIIKSKNKMSYFEKIKYALKTGKKSYKLESSYDENTLNTYITDIKNNYDRGKTEEKFEIDEERNVRYIEGKSALSLDIEKSKEQLLKDLKGKEIKDEIKLVYSEDKVENHESYKSIDTKVSSFTTEFNPYISRGTNLRTGLAYIDGAIVEPGEVFSFYKYAGPYNKRGYVFYYEFVGNGVCQIATTTYNAALLGGLEIVERYQHAEMVPYVKGGLDATVASYASGWYVDMKFKNTYKYPIYISAYATGGVAHVDFWSNSNAKEGKTYQTESVKVSVLGYKSYLHVYDSNGQEIEKRFLANSWYREKKN